MEVCFSDRTGVMQKDGQGFDGVRGTIQYSLCYDAGPKNESIRLAKHLNHDFDQSRRGKHGVTDDEQISTAQRLVRDVLSFAVLKQGKGTPYVLECGPDNSAKQLGGGIHSPRNGDEENIQREVSSVLVNLVVRYAQRLTKKEATYKTTLKEVEDAQLKLVAELEEHYRGKLSAAKHNHTVVIQEMEEKVKDELEKAQHDLEERRSRLNSEQREREHSLKELEISHKNSEKQLSTQVDTLYQKLKLTEQQERETLEQNRQLQEHCKTLQMAHDQARKDLESERTKTNELESENKDLLVEKEGVKQRLDETRTRNDQQHLQDTNTLSLLREQVDELRQERDSLHTALDSIRQSVASLIPLAPTIQAVLPSNSRPELPLVILATPSGPKPVMTAGSVDSGLASQHPSTGCVNQGVWPTPPQADGSVLMTLLPQSPDSVPADLSVSQISEGEELPPDHTYEPQYPTKSTAPELSIVHINQSESSIIVPPLIPTELANEVYTIQAMIEHLHQSIDALLKGYVLVSTQADVYHGRLGEVQQELVSSQTGITEQLKHIGQLQYQVGNLETQLPGGSENQEELTTQLYQANDKISTLIQQVEEMRAKNEDANKKSVIEVLETRQKLVTAEQELNAQRQLNRELKEKTERLEIEARKKIEAVQTENKAFEVKLAEVRKQAIDCMRLSKQLSEKEEVDGQLREELRATHDQLLAAQHQVATLESKDITDTLILEKQLQSEKRISQELQERLNQVVSSFEKDAEAFSKQETALQKQITELTSVISNKDGVLQGVQLEKEKIDVQCKELKEQVATLTEQVEGLHSGMKTSNEKVGQLCQRLEERDRELDSDAGEQTLLREKISQLQVESKGHLEVYEQSVVQIQLLQEELEVKQRTILEREKEVESQAVSNGELSQRVATLSKELEEKEQYYNTQAVELQEVLSETRNELRVRENELRVLKETHVDELGQLVAEHRGRLALLKLQYTEKIRKIGSDDQEMLEKIADLAPELEKNSGDVKRLCEKANLDGVKRLLRERERELAQVKAAVEQTSNSMNTLTSDNHRLKQELAEANETIASLEGSMEQASETIGELKKKMEHLISERDGLSVELSGTESRARQLLENEKTLNRELQERLNSLTVQCSTIQERAVVEEKRAMELEQRLLAKEEEIDALTDERRGRDESALNESQQDARETLVKCLEGERAAVAKLANSLQAKEAELTNAVDQYLQEKVLSAKNREEISALHSRISGLSQQMSLLQSNSERAVTRLEREKQQMRAELESLQTRVKKTDRQRKATLEAKPSSSESRMLLFRAKQAERRCKALVFQKKYLQSEIDAFYHTHHGALIMIKDMGGAVRRRKRQRLTFKTLGVLVIAVFRMQNLVRRNKRSKTFVSSPIWKHTPTMKTTPISASPKQTTPRQQGGSITIVMSKKDRSEGTDPQITAYLNEIKRIQERLNTKQ